MTVHNWNGHRIEVNSHALPKSLWLSMGFSVLINDLDRYFSPTHFEGLRTTVPFKITEAGNTINGHIESGRPCSSIYSSYSVFIENELIAKGSVRAKNWYATYAVIGLALSLFLIAFFTYGT